MILAQSVRQTSMESNSSVTVGFLQLPLPTSNHIRHEHHLVIAFESVTVDCNDQGIKRRF